MAESRRYQFRAPADVEGEIRQVWNDKQGETENLIRIIRAGAAALAKKGGGKSGRA